MSKFIIGITFIAVVPVLSGIAWGVILPGEPIGLVLSFVTGGLSGFFGTQYILNAE